MFRLTECKVGIRLFLLITLIGIFENTSSQEHYDFVYTNRNSFISAGWDFIGVTPTGYARNTEQTRGAVVSFDQTAHPGVIRVPVDAGDLYTGSNNTRNTLFRDLPSGWTSVRLKISSFAPQQNYQQAGLAIYQDDNNYIQITRNYNGSNIMTFLSETGGSATALNQQAMSATSNIHFRLDRDPSTESIAAYYSYNGTNWNYVGVVVHGLNDPKIAIVTGASPGGFPLADFAWVEVDYQSSSSDILQAHPGAIVFNGIQGQPISSTRSIYISTVNGGRISWNMSINGSWLHGDHQNGNTNDVLKVNVNTSGLPSGTYNGNVIIDSPQSTGATVVIPVTLIINPGVPVKVTTWKDGYAGAMSVSVDDGKYSGFDLLQAYGLKGTFVSNNTVPPANYGSMYAAGMELGSHLVTHPCYTISESILRYQEIEPNLSGLSAYAGVPSRELVTLVWPCGFTNYREQKIATDYFLSARGYNINKLEDATPENFMNLKSYNSEEHFPYPPADYKTLVDHAVAQNKWFNLVLHDFSNDDGAINYAPSRNIWVAPIGTVIKYIMQRERFILTNYNASRSKITFNVSRLSIPSSALRSFENAFGSADISTLEIDIDDTRTIDHVLINGSVNPYQIKDLNGNDVLITNVRLESTNVKSVEIKYVYTGTTIGLTITGVTANNRPYNGNVNASLNTAGAALVGVEPGDVVTLNSIGATGTFANKNAGTSIPVAISGFTIGGHDSGNYNLILPAITGNILQKELIITANSLFKPNNTELTFKGNEFTAQGLAIGDAIPLLLINSLGKGASALVGTYPIYISGGSDPNYIYHFVNGILTVNKAVLTASADNKTKTYGSENPDLSITYSGFINNDNISMINVLPVISTNALTTSDAGNYTISISGGRDDCYDFAFLDGVLEIKKAPLVVAAKDKTKIYLEANPVLEIVYSGFAENENQNFLNKIPLTETDADFDSNAGDYPINVFGGADKNYYFTYKKGTLRIDKAEQSIVFEDVPDGLRISQQHLLNASTSSGLPVTFVLSDPSTGTLNNNLLTIKKDGSITLIAKQEGNINYHSAPIVTQSIVALPTFDNINSLFTPNSDGMNDYWYIPDLEQYGRAHVIVYNRFGKAVYESESYTNDWDGTWDNDPLPAASYYYIIKSSEAGLIKGVVNLVR